MTYYSEGNNTNPIVSFRHEVAIKADMSAFSDMHCFKDTIPSFPRYNAATC